MRCGAKHHSPGLLRSRPLASPKFPILTWLNLVIRNHLVDPQAHPGFWIFTDEESRGAVNLNAGLAVAHRIVVETATITLPAALDVSGNRSVFARIRPDPIAGAKGVVGACPRHQHRNKHQYSRNAKHTLGPSLGPPAPGSIVDDIARRRTSHVVFIAAVRWGSWYRET
jgi:hypothetical protein